MRLLLSLAFAALAASCANPLNRVTSDRYHDECAAAERAGNLALAEQLCYRSLVNVDIGNLGPELKSQRLYNLARIKRRVSKFSEAEDLLRQSIVLEEKLSGQSSVPMARRFAELSVNLAGLNRWNEGVIYLKQLVPISSQFSGSERSFIITVLREYAKHLERTGESALAEALVQQANTLTLQ